MDDRDRLLDVLLSEELGGEVPPDVTDRVLRRAFRARRRIAMAVAVAAVAALALGIWASVGRRPEPRVPQAAAARDAEMQHSMIDVVKDYVPRRGETVDARDEPVTVRLGGYAHVMLEAGSVARIEGEERAERIHLVNGAVHCEVDSKIGSFAVHTDVGTVETAGTRFEVRLLDEKGQGDMATKRLYVKVLVGVVLATGAWGEQRVTAGQAKTLPAPKVPKTMVTLSHVDDSAEGKKSLAGSGHAVEFQAPEKARWVEAVQIFGARYGMPQPPKEDFHVYVLDAEKKVLADVPFSYATVERGDMRWYMLRTPSIEVTERFTIALSFNPGQTRGVYLGTDSNVDLSHSLTGTPGRGLREVAEKYDWMVRVVLSPKPTGKKGIVRLADGAAGKPTLALPPYVVESVPASRAVDVDYMLREIKVTYDRPMTVGENYSWMIQSNLGTYPGVRGGAAPRWEADGKTCVLPVRLSPDTVYAIGVNSYRHTGFRDRNGKIAVPYILIFKTRKEKKDPDF
ncbi:FecR domain-containing protein [bacterium]|nr:FecR domain-containing protein [bacterium]